MPDSTWATVSASQAPALFNLSPYITRWGLWHAFRNRDTSLIEKPETERMRLGKRYQALILERVAEDHRLDVIGNEADEYVRRDQLGCTRDAHMIAPDLGRVIVEAKRIHWLRWRTTWTETAAAMDIEIQLQTQLYAERCDHGIIAGDTGDDDLVYHRREANKVVHERLVEETRLFFESLKEGKEPDPLGSPVELPELVALYPEAKVTEVLEDYSEEMEQLLRVFYQARGDAKFNAKLEEQMKVKLLAAAKTAGIVRANGFLVTIKKSHSPEGICVPHAAPKVIRKASVRTLIEIEKVEPVITRDDPFLEGKNNVG